MSDIILLIIFRTGRQLFFQDIFQLIVGTLGGVRDMSGSSFGRRVVILETLIEYRSSVVMLHLECDDLVNEILVYFWLLLGLFYCNNFVSIVI